MPACPACSRCGATRSAARACCTAISIKQRYPGHAVQAGHVAAQCGASAYASKYIVVVDDDVDVTNLEHTAVGDAHPHRSRRSRSSSSPARGIRRADPALPPEKRAAGDMTHSVALIDACKPFHWRDKFPPTNAPSPEVARKAKEKFGWLLEWKEIIRWRALAARTDGVAQSWVAPAVGCNRHENRRPG